MAQRVDPNISDRLMTDRATLRKIRSVEHLYNYPPSVAFEHDVFFNQEDNCFYHCVMSDNIWKWMKVTYGYKHQYVLPVSYITAAADINTVIDTLKLIMAEMSYRYQESFDPMIEGASGISEETAIAKYIEIATYINTMCGTNLVTNDTAPNVAKLVKYVNCLVSVINPGAAAILFIKTLAGCASLTTDGILAISKMCADLIPLTDVPNGTIMYGYLYYNRNKYSTYESSTYNYKSTEGYETQIDALATKSCYIDGTTTTKIFGTSITSVRSENGWVFDSNTFGTTLKDLVNNHKYYFSGSKII